METLKKWLSIGVKWVSSGVFQVKAHYQFSLLMPTGAVHPNGSNFQRGLRHNILSRMRRLVDSNCYDPPVWLPVVEKAPPLDLSRLTIKNRNIKNHYVQMVNFVLKKYPDLRFQDCFVDGNDWSKGNDTYRSEHPVMQFVARQMKYINEEGLTKKEAFAKTEAYFYERRLKQEVEQKILMATMPARTVKPFFTSGQAYYHDKIAQNQSSHLRSIIKDLKQLKTEQSRRPSKENKVWEAEYTRADPWQDSGEDKADSWVSPIQVINSSPVEEATPTLEVSATFEEDPLYPEETPTIMETASLPDEALPVFAERVKVSSQGVADHAEFPFDSPHPVEPRTSKRGRKSRNFAEEIKGGKLK